MVLGPGKLRCRLQSWVRPLVSSCHQAAISRKGWLSCRPTGEWDESRADVAASRQLVELRARVVLAHRRYAAAEVIAGVTLT